MDLQNLENGKALKGYDPVSVYNNKAKIGDKTLTSIYQNAIYQFASVENKIEFDKQPKRYQPKYGGYCSIAVSEGVLVDANPHSSLVQDEELHVFYKDENEDTQDEWRLKPIENKKQAELSWIKLLATNEKKNAQE